MTTFRKTWILSIMIVLLAGPAAAYYGYEKPSKGGGSTDSFYLSFSIGEGTYVNYKCDVNECEAAIIAPLDFEVLLGYKIAPHFYIDLGLNWAVDYYYYDKVTYFGGLRPGVRIILPGLFHRHLYFRGAVPIRYSLAEEHEKLIIGVLLGVGLEWRFANMGFFVEADFTPYFVEVYPGYYVIPVEGRAGISVRF